MEPQQFVGSFRFVSQENVDAYLEAIGASEEIRERAKASHPHIQCAIDGQQDWTLKIHWGVHETTIRMRLGVEQETRRRDGILVKILFQMDGSNKLIQKDSWQSLLGNNEEVITTHEVNGDDWTMVIAGTTCV